MMEPDTRRVLGALFKKIALVGVLLVVLTTLCLRFIDDPDMKMAVTVLAALAASGSAYYFASVAPLWVAIPWLKGMLCVLAVLAGAGSFVAAGTVGLFAYAAVSGETHSGGSSGGFSSWD